jgi:hypothetical protein
MNHEAPLPVVFPPNGDPVLESLYIGDDVARFSHRVVNAELRVLIKQMQDGDTAEAKFNGISLPPPTVQDGGWRVFTLSPDCFALGPNLVGARLVRKNPQSKQCVSIEKLEVHVFYKENTDK